MKLVKLEEVTIADASVHDRSLEWFEIVLRFYQLRIELDRMDLRKLGSLI